MRVLSRLSGRKSNFLSDLRDGHWGEDRVSAVLVGAGLSVSPALVRAHDIEVEVGGRRLTLESKHDRMACRTGNIAIEYYNPRKGTLSGILGSEADLWAYVLTDGTVWACSRRTLRAYFEATPGVRDIANAGDGNASVRLFSIDAVLGPVLVRIDHLPAAELLATVAGFLAA